MTSLIEKEKSCEPPEEKKCKVPKVKHVEKEPECIEPGALEVREKVLYEPTCNTEINVTRSADNNSSNSTDPQSKEREKCLTDCKVEPIYIIWKECDKRVTRKSHYTSETCHEETIDLMEALDKCVQDKAFLQLK